MRGAGYVLGVVLWSCLLTLGCDAEPEWLASLERAHWLADRAESVQELEHAEQALESAYGAIPDEPRADIEWARQDACGRLARLALQRKRFDTALDWANRGLALSSRLTVATPELLRLKGEALEAQGKKEQAADAYYEALQRNQELLDQALGEGTR